MANPDGLRRGRRLSKAIKNPYSATSIFQSFQHFATNYIACRRDISFNNKNMAMLYCNFTFAAISLDIKSIM